MVEPPYDQAALDQRLDEVLANYFRAQEAGCAPTPAELLARHSDLASGLEAFFADQDRFEILAAPLRQWSGTSVLPGSGDVVGNHELLEVLAQGGMGVVYRARQRPLGRIVALKMLRAGRLATRADSERFRLEAEASARLDHSHIVPIYEVGDHEGHPYFSMKFLAGGSLAQHREQVSGSPRQAAQFLATVAEAVHYAHQRGILHRDLKPGNILLDEAGTPHVSDFGLAKRLAGAEDSDAVVPLTQTGAIVGTPSYMAPEQASGQPAAVTTGADIFSLGAILYELLTGRPPFRAATPLETLRCLAEREPERPSRLRPGLDRDLETICLKCLEKEPARRYATAADLAADLRRWLAGEPILARPARPWSRLGRWCRRNPVIAGLTAALVLSLVGGFVLVAVLWRQAADHARNAEAQAQRAQEQAQRAEEERARARADLALTHQAIRKFCLRISDQELARTLGPHPVERDLAEEALDYLQRALEQHAADTEPAPETAELCHLASQLLHRLGRSEEALALLDRELDLYQDLLARTPENATLQTGRGMAFLSRGFVYYRLGRWQESRDNYRRARVLLEEALGQEPEAPDALFGIAHVLHAQAEDAERLNDFGAARDLYRQGQRQFETLVRLRPAMPSYCRDLANLLQNFGVFLEKRPETLPEAIPCFEEARRLRAELAQRPFASSADRRSWVEAERNLAGALWKAERKTEAEAILTQGVGPWETMVAERPSDLSLRHELARNYNRLGLYQTRTGKKAKGVASYQQACAQFSLLARATPKDRALKEELATCLFDTGVVEGELGQRPEAQRLYEQARDQFEEVLRLAPDKLEIHSRLGDVLNNLGVNLAQQGRLEDGARTLRQGLEHHRLVYRQAPDNTRYRQSLNYLYGSLAEVERVAGRLDVAAALTVERWPLCGSDPKELYRVARDMGDIAGRVGAGQPVLSHEQEGQRHCYAVVTLEVLRQARVRGFRNAEQLRKEPAFQFLRANAEFQRLLKAMAQDQVARSFV